MKIVKAVFFGYAGGILCILTVLVFLVSCDKSDDPLIQYIWKFSTPEEQGLNDSILNILVEDIENGDYGEIHSLLIVRHDFIVKENYFRGYGRASTHCIYSDTKSVTSALVGIARGQGLISGLDRPILDYFPEYDDIENMDEDKAQITVEDLLTMRSGLYWDEFTYSFDNPENSIYQIIRSPDWLKYVLDLPMIYSPGARFRYNTGNTVLLSGIILKETGMSAEDFAASTLFEALEITNYDWEEGANSLTNTGWGLHICARDMAKFGLLFLHNGLLNGRRIIPEGWVELSTSVHVTINDDFSYGYQWWMMPLRNVSGHDPEPDDIKIARGYGQQFIFVIPALDMVVVSTAGNYDISEDYAIEFLREYIIAAVID